MSKTVANIAAGAARIVTAPLKPWRRAQADARAAEALMPVWKVETDAGRLDFIGVSGRSLHDAYGWNRDEPETVKWIASLPQDAVLWDIGANVGAYTLYAAKRGVRVIAFEPSAATLYALTRNIERNQLSHLIAAYPIAFAETTRLDALFMAHTEPGHAMHSFGTRETIEGTIQGGFAQAALGYSVDDFLKAFSPPAPTHVKLDVDGIEDAILRGARETLRTHVREVLVEIDGATKERGGTEIRAALVDAGFAEVEGYAPEAARNRLFRRT